MELPERVLFSYWQQYWVYCIEVLTDNDNVSFKIIGPQMMLRDLVEELEGHGLSNQDNISFFRKQLSGLDKNDEVFHSLCHPIVACLLDRLGDKVNKGSCIILCKKILNALAEKRYFALLVDHLAEVIDKTPDYSFDSRNKINEITHLIIAEFVAEGFVLEEIKKYATNIPKVVTNSYGVVQAAPSEYESLKETDFPSQQDYYKAVSELINNRDVYKCLDVLKYHYYATPKKAFVIVRLNGLKGQIDDYIGDINIYSPKLKQYINKQHAISNVESVTNARDRVNAAIPIDFISLDRAKVCAKAKLEEVLDLLMLTYRTKAPVTMATNIFAVVADGKEISMSFSARGNDPSMASRDDILQYLDALDLTDVKGEGFKYLSEKHNILEVRRGALNRRLKNAAHWFAKAASADKDVDVLLYSWFAIEGLLKIDSRTQSEMADKTKDLNSLGVIQEFVTSIICMSYFRYYLRDTYRRFLFYTNQYNNHYGLSEEVIGKAGLNLNTGDQYRDGDFFSAVPAIIDCINNAIAKDELAHMQEFYQNENGLKNKALQIKDDLLMIYRLRNMIVHNAALSCVNIAFYAREARSIAQQVIQYVIDKASGDRTIDEIVLEAKLDYQVFLENFDEEFKMLIKEVNN